MNPFSVIGLGSGVLGSIVGAIGGSNARNKQRRMIDAEDRRNEDMFRNEYYKNQLDRTENAAALQKAHDFLKERSRIDTKTAAITGATPEAVAASKKANLSSYSDLTSKIAAQGSAARDRIRGMYEANKKNIFGMRNDLLENQVKQYGNMTTNAMGVVGNNLNNLYQDYKQKNQ